ncbi:MAG TPA: peptidoglycan bridge formation glycyltransferase FemA/FemB family protein [Candidatus Sulfotelmatobacter sp.]|jgi:lipid II:glycine glycyltransferase (peptidoglycan interpeptide bridge formation enzyme)|nr:peptidoglycan bridge formation glycyltransferase FemA/FemB family protein [Candidatus Sulfotelmatobacter sp.]
MTILPLTPKQKAIYNAVVTHPLQSYEWGEFREKEGIKVIRRGFFEKETLINGFQLTIHKIPKTNFTIGYLPKGDLPTKELLNELQIIGKQEKCIFIQLEPNLIQNKNDESKTKELGLRSAAHPLFTKHNFVLNLMQSEDDLLKHMHPKTRYNIKVANKHNVKVVENNSEKAFVEYWRLIEETTKRQKFYAHTQLYHELQWHTFTHSSDTNKLTSHLFTATYKGKILTTLLFFVFHDTLYYPYGASSNEHRNVMHSNLAMWEGIRFGKRLGLKKFDMWGALGKEPDTQNPWYGFHDFKRKFGPEHVESMGSYDLVINQALYQAYKIADKLRWLYLMIKKYY